MWVICNEDFGDRKDIKFFSYRINNIFCGKNILWRFFGRIYFDTIDDCSIQRKKGTNNREEEMLISVSDGLKTGYSVENAIQASYKDMGVLHGKNSIICYEIKIMISQLKLNVGTEKVIDDFAKRIQLKNARLFAEVFRVSKKTGGNMPQIIKNVTDDIVLKEETREEICAAITEKRIEQKVMTIIPIFIIVYITITSPGFLDIMYDTLFGKLIMTGCIAAYAAAYIWGEKIIRSIVQE